MYSEGSKINLANIFNNIQNLISAEFISTTKAKILTLDGAFQNCSNLENVTINGFDTSEVKSMNKVFYNNSFLSKIELDDNFQPKMLKICHICLLIVIPKN